MTGVKVFLLVTFLFGLRFPLKAQPDSRLPEMAVSAMPEPKIIIGAMYGIHFNVQASDFFSSYEKLLPSSTVKNFDALWLPHVEVLFARSRQLHIGASIEYANQTKEDVFLVTEKRNDSTYIHNVHENITATFLPVRLEINYALTRERTVSPYVGAGVGAAFSTFSWKESVQESGARDTSIEGKSAGNFSYYEGARIVPSVDLRLGCELIFDQLSRVRLNIVRSLYAEAGYRMALHSVNFFERVKEHTRTYRETFKGPPVTDIVPWIDKAAINGLPSEATINYSSFWLAAGIRFQF